MGVGVFVEKEPIVLGPTLTKEAFGLKLGKNVRKILECAHEFPEGRWLFIIVESKQDLSDVEHLLQLKARPLQNR